MSSGTLYIVATPIGHLDDFSARAIQILQTAQEILAEDTRHSAPLLRHFGIQTRCTAYHEHNEQERTAEIIKHLQKGAVFALISDAGTPLISDPGYRLVHAAQQAEIKIIPVPGACALITALSAAGLPSDRFIFEGFLPAKQTARLKHLSALQNEVRTLIFYEAPHRVLETVADFAEVFGLDREIVIARELTKTFETIRSGSIENIQQWLQQDLNQQKGEFVILVHGANKKEIPFAEKEALRILSILQDELPLSQAVKLAAKITGVNKNWLYETALSKE